MFNKTVPSPAGERQMYRHRAKRKIKKSITSGRKIIKKKKKETVLPLRARPEVDSRRELGREKREREKERKSENSAGCKGDVEDREL